MPVITAQAPRGTVDAQTQAPHQLQPKKELVANTKASYIQNPFTAAEQEGLELPVNTQESERPIIAEEESAAPHAVTLSSQATAIARREQKFRQQEQAFKAERAKFEAEKAEIESLKPIKAKLQAKDFSALEELGVSYEDYTNYLLNKPEDDPAAKAYNELREELNSIKDSQKKNEEKQYDATVQQYRNDIKDLVAKDPQFASIKESGAEDHVLQHILTTFEEDGEVLSVEQAAKEVEDQIIEDAIKLAKLSKVQAKLTPEKKTLPPPQQRTGLRTLTQQIAPPASQARNSMGQFQHLSPRERLAQAVAKANRQKE